MKLETLNLKRYGKIFQQIKIGGNPYYDHVFLDFRKNLLSFYNSSSLVRADLNISGEPDRDFLYVDGAKFFSLIGAYDSLEINKGKFFTPKGDKFFLPSLEEDLSISLEEDYSGETHSIIFSESFVVDLEICREFLDKNMNFPALFFEKEKIVAISQIKCIQAPSGLHNASFSIPAEVLRVISSLGVEKEEIIEFRMKESSNGGKIIEFNHKDLFYKFSSSSDIQLPVDIESEDFISNYRHEEFFVLNLKELEESLKTISMFVDPNTSHCKIEFISEDLLRIIVLTDSEIEYSLKVDSISDYSFFESKSFWISIQALLSATSSFLKKKSEGIRIRYSDDAPAIKIVSDSDLKEETFIIQTLIEDPSL